MVDIMQNDGLIWCVWRCSDARKSVWLVARCHSKKVAELVMDYTLANSYEGVSAYIDGGETSIVL
jgi:hypothetical protein